MVDQNVWRSHNSYILNFTENSQLCESRDGSASEEGSKHGESKKSFTVDNSVKHKFQNLDQ